MINLDFKIDEQELAEDLMYDLPKFDESLFVISVFMMPVRFAVDGTELFKFQNHIWFKMPLMSVASEGLGSLLRAKRWGKDVYDIIEGPGEMEFTMVDDQNVEIFFNELDDEIRIVVNYIELLKAFQDFANKVRAFLFKRVPQMNEHPYWGPWLLGEREY